MLTTVTSSPFLPPAANQAAGIFYANLALGFFFAVELGAKFKGYGGPGQYLDSGWKWNEVAIVVVWFTEFLVILLALTSKCPEWLLKTLSGLQVLRAVR